MERLQILVALALVAAVAAPVLAHGGTTQEEKTQGNYRVIHYTYVSVEEEEFIRPAWEVVNTSDSSRSDLSGQSVTFEFYVDGSVDRTEDFTLQECSQNCRDDIEDPEGKYFANVDTGTDTTRIDNTLTLPDDSTVTFSLTDVSQSGGGNGGNGNGGNGNGVPLPGWVALIALAGAALVVTRRRR